jgi:hypothetical protein
MQPRKVQRAFTGLVGLPPEPDEPPVVPPPTPPSARGVPALKRGRPTKGDDATTPAERQRARRERVRREKTAPERDRLIKMIVRRIKTSEHGSIAAMRRALEKFRDLHNTLTVDQLRDLAKVYTNYHDRKGRTVLEGHSGTKLVAGEFIQRLENISAKAQIEEMIGGRKAGGGPPTSEDDECDDQPSSTASGSAYEEPFGIFCQKFPRGCLRARRQKRFGTRMSLRSFINLHSVAAPAAISCRRGSTLAFTRKRR